MRLIGAGPAGLKHYGRAEDGGIQLGDIRFFETDPGPGWSKLHRDLTAWEVTRPSVFSNYTVPGLVYTGGVWITRHPASASAILYSSDLATWSQAQVQLNALGFIDGAFGASRFICIGQNSTNIQHGASLTSLTLQTAPFNYASVIDFGLDRFFLGGSNGQIATSTTGLPGSWTLSATGINSDVAGFAFGPGTTAVAVGSNKRAVSTDGGATWATAEIGALPASSPALSIARGNDVWVVGSHQGRVYRTSDLQTWTSEATGLTDDQVASLVFGGDMFAAAGRYYGGFATSTSGANWIVRRASPGPNRVVSAMTFDGSKFVGAGGTTPNPYVGELYTWHASTPLGKTPYIRVQ